MSRVIIFKKFLGGRGGVVGERTLISGRIYVLWELAHVRIRLRCLYVRVVTGSNDQGLACDLHHRQNWKNCLVVTCSSGYYNKLDMPICAFTVSGQCIMSARSES